MRKIPEKVKEKALNMWLQGRSYREIKKKLGVSIGAISDIVAEARKQTPDLLELRKINVMVMEEGGVSVYDAVRGGRLLDQVNQLGVSLERLGEFVELANRVASEKEVESSEFVDSAVRLLRLEAKTGKNYKEVINDFEGKLSEAKKLEAEIGALKDEAEGIKARFGSQGLDWNDGIALLRGISDLRVEKRVVTDKLTALKTELKEEEKELHATKRTTSRQRARIRELGRKIREQLKTYNYYSNWLHYKIPEIVRYQDELEEHTEKAEMKLRQLQEKVQGADDRVNQLERRERDLSMNIKNLEVAKEKTEKACQKIIDDAEIKRKAIEKNCEQMVGDSRKRGEKIVKDAEEEKRRILAEAEESRKEKERLEAEKELVEAAIKRKLEILRNLDKKVNEIEQNKVRESETPAETLPRGIRLPKLPPLPEEGKNN